MLAVIFRAELNELDEAYAKTAERMKELAIQKYGCLDFWSVAEGRHEISISYWPNQEQIRKWKNDPEHLAAQEAGKAKWYKSYQVQVVEVLHEYGNT